MPTIIPIERAGEGQNETFIYDRVWGSLGSLAVLAAEEITPPALGSLGISGEGAFAGLGSLELNGDGIRPALGSLQTGAAADSEGLGSADIGTAPLLDAASGSMGLNGELPYIALASLGIQNNPSVSGYLIYLALGTLELASGFHDPSPGSVGIVGETQTAARSSVAVKGVADAASGGTLELGQEAGYPAHASLDTGGESNSVSPGSADIRDGEGVDFIIDIQDEILASGHGDC